MKSIWEYTPDEIEAFGELKPEDDIDFTFPEGFFRTANSMKMFPDTMTRVQMLYAFCQMVEIE